MKQQEVVVLLLKLGKLALLLILPAWSMTKTSLSRLLSRPPKPEGVAIDAKLAEALHECLGRIRQRLGGPPLKKILITADLNAAVVQYPRLGLFGWHENYPMPALNRLLAQAPDHREGRFRRALVSLHTLKDPAGIDDLEYPMATHTKAVVPCARIAYDFYAETNEAKADQYRQRAEAHMAERVAIDRELRTLRNDDQLAEASLSTDAWNEVSRILRLYAKDIREYRVARRILVTRPNEEQHVLVFEVNNTWRKRADVGDLTRRPGLHTFPGAFHIVPLRSPRGKALHARMQGMGVEAQHPARDWQASSPNDHTLAQGVRRSRPASGPMRRQANARAGT